ncbi:hypothetical protein PQR26_38760 [Paraburkholderia sediminicola]
MLQSLEALARDHGLVSMRLDATLNAAPFYRYCGWSGESISTYRTSGRLLPPAVGKNARLNGRNRERWQSAAGQRSKFVATTVSSINCAATNFRGQPNRCMWSPRIGQFLSDRSCSDAFDVRTDEHMADDCRI